MSAFPPLEGGGAPVITERRRAVSGGAWNAASAVMPMASTLLLSVVIERSLGADALGQQSLIAFVSSLFVSLLVMSVVAASIQALSAARGRDDDAEVAWLSRVSTAVHLAAGVVSCLVLVVFGLGRGELEDVWYVAGVTVLLDSIGWSMSSRIVARDGWSRVGARRLVSQAAAPLLGIVALFAGLGITGVFAAQAVASLGLVLLLRPVQARAPLAPSRGATHPPVRVLTRVWAMFVLSSVLTQVVERRLEVVFLDAYSVAREIAMYSIAFNLVSIAYYVCTAGIGAATASVAALSAAGAHERVADALARSSRLVVVLTIGMAAAIASVGPFLVETVYGDAGEAAALVPWLCLSLLLAPLGHLMQVYWSGIARLKPVLLSGAAGAVVDVVLAVALIPDHGAAGAVAANVAGQCTAAALIVVHTARRVPGLRVPVALVIRSVLVAAPSGALAVLAGQRGGSLGVLAAGAAFVAAAVLISRVVALVDEEDLQWVLGALPEGPGRVLGWIGRPGLRVTPRSSGR